MSRTLLQHFVFGELQYNFFSASIMCFRARIYCCKRNLKAARYDFEAVLRLDPGNEAASRGLAAIDEDVDELPMLSRDLLDL